MTINTFDDHLFLCGIPDDRGRQCEAGRKFVSIAPDGDVNRCGTHDAAGRELARGNILNGSFRPEARPQPCATS